MSKKPTKKPTVQVVEIPSEVYQQFKRMVKANGQTMRWMIRFLIQQYIDEQDRK